MSVLTNKRAIIDWDEYRKALIEETYIDLNLSNIDIKKQRENLEQDIVEWIYFFFPKYAKSKFAKFQIKFFHRILRTNILEWYEVLSWARELSKSTCVMFIVLYLVLTGKKKNIILTSNSYDNAVRLLEPYRANLDSNARIIKFYGKQQQFGSWEVGEFKTKTGASFRALGARQSPRGTRNEDFRVDCLLIDDFDTDEECRNPQTIKQKWEWFEQALYFTRSFSEPLITIWCGNIIAKDCCIVRAGKKAKELATLKEPLGNWDIINIRMVNINKPNPKNDYQHGKSVWTEKNSEEQIDIVLAQVSTASAQKECFNNPVTEGTIFKEIHWGKCPPLNSLKFVVVYADPSTSNKDRTNIQKGVSFKAMFVIGYKNGKFYVYTGYLDQVGTDNFIQWAYDLKKYINNKTATYYYIENNTLQDPYYEQIYKPKFSDYKNPSGIIPMSPDTRKKPEKFIRIEANLEPLNRTGALILNEAEKNNPNMKRLEEQFLLIDEKLSSPADGPDCIEGGVFITQQKNTTTSIDSIQFGSRPINKKRV